MSLGQFGTVWFSLSFSSIKRKRYKNQLFNGSYIENCKVGLYGTAKESIGKQMVEYRRQPLDLTPSDMETEIQRDKFPSIAVSSLRVSGRFRSNLNMLC